MPNIEDYWFRYKSACEIEGQKLEYISKQALTELIAEIISSPVEPEVMQKAVDEENMPMLLELVKLCYEIGWNNILVDELDIEVNGLMIGNDKFVNSGFKKRAFVTLTKKFM